MEILGLYLSLYFLTFRFLARTDLPKKWYLPIQVRTFRGIRHYQIHIVFLWIFHLTLSFKAPFSEQAARKLVSKYKNH